MISQSLNMIKYIPHNRSFQNFGHPIETSLQNMSTKHQAIFKDWLFLMALNALVKNSQNDNSQFKEYFKEQQMLCDMYFSSV